MNLSARLRLVPPASAVRQANISIQENRVDRQTNKPKPVLEAIEIEFPPPSAPPAPQDPTGAGGRSASDRQQPTCARRNRKTDSIRMKAEEST